MKRLTQFVSTGLLVPATLTLLAACGGGGGNDSILAVADDIPVPVNREFIAGQFLPSSDFKDFCADPRTGAEFNDVLGTRLDENQWLRSFSNETYLWYNEIVDLYPADFQTDEYFELMRTNEVTDSGKPKDQFHFSIDTEEFTALSESGTVIGYGVELAILDPLPPREIIVAFTEPNSPATAEDVNLPRGSRILEVDGRDAINGNTRSTVKKLNEALFPTKIGEEHDFLIVDGVTGELREITMTSAAVVTDPVQNVKVVGSLAGPVGYLTFNSHIDTAEAELFDAMTTLEAAGVNELVLDMRYNGGGLLLIANQLAAMIAGPAAASGHVFEDLVFNDKNRVFDPITGAPNLPDFFMQTTFGRGDSEPGRVLPALNLNRVFVLSGPGTCSASESIINGLRGIGVEVVLIGETTCGKPFGFYPVDNCGTTYFTVQFQGVNELGFGDYADGFSPANATSSTGVSIPGCEIPDDFTAPLGSPFEARFSAALTYIEDGVCPVTDLGILSNSDLKKKSGDQTEVSKTTSNNAVPASVGEGLAIDAGPSLRMPGSVRTRAGSF